MHFMYLSIKYPNMTKIKLNDDITFIITWNGKLS